MMMMMIGCEVAERRRAHLQLLEGMHELYNDYRGTYRGLTFRPSTYKKDPFFQCVAINLHSQIMSVTIPDRPISRTFEVTTFGAPAAHYYKYGCWLDGWHLARFVKGSAHVPPTHGSKQVQDGPAATGASSRSLGPQHY